MYERNSVGPNAEPCGTPCLILAQFETAVLWFVLLSIMTRWYLPLRYDWKSSLPLPITPLLTFHGGLIYFHICCNIAACMLK
jgi:hypothetical protein